MMEEPEIKRWTTKRKVELMRHYGQQNRAVNLCG